jgi:heme exporter protein CcmD
VTHVGYLVAGFGATFAVVATYAAWIIGKKRALARELASEEREPRWR